MEKSADDNMADMFGFISSGFMETSLNYWFSNHEHIRSPFPAEIRDSLKENSCYVFTEWLKGLPENDRINMPENEFAEMFETFLFNEALKLVDDEDRKLTIIYPFMPRVGDTVNHGINGTGEVIGRRELVSAKNRKLFELTVLIRDSGKTWKTQFELTE